MQAKSQIESAGGDEEEIRPLSAEVIGERPCEQCGQRLLSYRYGGIGGWSHAEKACDPFEEPWSRWSLEWAAKFRSHPGFDFGQTGRNEPNPSFSCGKNRVFLRTNGPVSGNDIMACEDAGRPNIWLWEAASKSIFLNSDGYLRVNGRGTVISSATMPVVLDFGPGFLTRDGFVSKVAHVLDHRLVKDNLYLKIRWLSHGEFVKELYECPNKFFESTVSSPVSTT
jgi:hypothetical protein